MSDIVERLRRWTHAADAAPASDLIDEAAAEIERLRLTDAEREAMDSNGPVVVPATVLPGNFAGVKWNSCCRRYRKALDKAGIKWISEASPEPEASHDATLTQVAQFFCYET